MDFTPDYSVSNIEINDGNIKSFERVAKKYGIDYALKKDKSENPPKYLVFFKGRDTDVLNLAFKEYVGKQMKQKDKPSIMENLPILKRLLQKARTGSGSKNTRRTGGRAYDEFKAGCSPQPEKR